MLSYSFSVFDAAYDNRSHIFLSTIIVMRNILLSNFLMHVFVRCSWKQLSLMQLTRLAQSGTLKILKESAAIEVVNNKN